MSFNSQTVTRTIQDIRNIVRQVTGNFDPTQLSDSQIDHRVNDFYLFDFPEELRILKLRTFHTFRTKPNVGQYSVPDQYYMLSNPVYVGGYECSWNQDPSQFYKIWPEYRFIQTQVATGNGTTGPYTFTLSQTPILQGSVTISADATTEGAGFTTQVARDVYTADQITGNPAITKNIIDISDETLATYKTAIGSINYLTGAVSITFSTIIPAGVSINCQYYPYVASRPRDVFFFTQQYDVIDPLFSATQYQTYQKEMIILRAVPNDSYEVKMTAFIRPVQFLEGQTATTGQNPVPGGQQPEWAEWFRCLAYGASVHILREQGDHSEAERYFGYMEEARIRCQRKLIRQLAPQRIPTIYQENNIGANVAPFPVFPIY